MRGQPPRAEGRGRDAEPVRPDDFNYDLPDELIATHPAARRDASRLLRLARDSGELTHRVFRELPTLLRPGDCLVLNDSRVLPARLRLRRESGGLVELLLVERMGDAFEWLAMARPARKLTVGARLPLAGDSGEVEILGPGSDERTRRVRFHLNGGETCEAYLERHGEMPLPPYILQQRRAHGEQGRGDAPEDRERYQTVYSREAGSVAAPTAGLHFTPELLAELETRGVEIQRVALHVGIGTFAPLNEENLRSGRLHRESYEIGEAAARAIESARREPGRRVVAVGTTSVRTLESCLAEHGSIRAGRSSTQLFIRPAFEFRVVKAMVTNFHLPESSLLMLVAAFAGRERVLAAYREAIRERYRFFSYGDAMLIE